MAEILMRLSWFFVASCIVAYAVFFAAGAAINARASQEAHMVVIRDALRQNEHHLSGIVMVPSTCAQLSVRPEQLSQFTYRLIFETWEHPSVTCDREETARQFRSIVFAPSTGVHFDATLNGAVLPIVIIPVVE